jgi:uncharacterized membrane protein
MLFVFLICPWAYLVCKKTYRRENTQKEISEDKCDEKIPGTVADNF